MTASKAARRLWIGALAAFTATVIAFWAALVWHDRAQEIDAAYERLRATVHLMSVHASGALKAGFDVLDATADAAARADLDDPNARAALHELLRRLATGATAVGSAWILDAGGETVAETWGHPPRGGNGAGRDYFIAVRDGGPDPYLSEASRGPILGRNRFTISRALRGPNGAFRGVAVVGMESGFFAELYKQLDVVPGTRLVLTRGDGRRFARWPEEGAVASPAYIKAFAERIGARTVGADVLEDEDGPRLVAWMRVGDFPAVAVASVPRAAELAGWRQRTSLSALAALIAIAGFGVLGLHGLRGAAREATMRRSLQEANALLDDRVAERTTELEALYRDAPVGLALFDEQFRFIRVNATLAKMNGRPVEDHIGRSAHEIVPEIARVVEPSIRKVFETGQSVQGLELRGETDAAPGVPRVWIHDCYPVKDKAGRVAAVGAIVREVTGERRAQERERLLANEVDHRAKNLLAVITALLRQTAGQTVQEFREAAMGRIRALGRTHTLLAASRWEGASVERIVGEELAPYAGPSRVDASGPAILLAPAQAQGFAMVVHELATNAAKHGALSRPEGAIAIRWSEDPPGCLHFSWVESGGPAVTPPARRGLGTSVIERTVRDQFGGTVSVDWRPEGLACRIAVPDMQIGRVAPTA